MSLREKLLNPEAWPVRADRVEFLETHISELYFVGDRVYKVKKAVDLGFLDFRTLESRCFYCQEELRLNRRLSPDVYLGVREIREDEHGRVRLDGPGKLLEPAVEMRRLPADRMLDQLLDRGDLDNSMMRALANRLHRFHATAERGPDIDEWGRPAAVERNALENFDQVREPLKGLDRDRSPISAPQLGWLGTWTRRFLKDHRGLLARRVEEGRICDGHGDLHAGNICFQRDGGEESIRIYDCLEFAPRYRQADVACDLAFLLMDLDARGYRAFSSWLLHEYGDLGQDPELGVLMPFYKGYRACVRAKVALLRSLQLSDAAAFTALEEARSYFQLALSYTLPPVLILLCGLPACGKSVAAEVVARPFEARILESDRVRKIQHGLRPQARSDSGLREGIYTPSASQEVYAELLFEARASLEEGRSVVVDAGFRRVRDRRPFLDLARGPGLPCTILHLTVPEAITRTRMATRAANENSTSEADWSVYLALAKDLEACEEIPANQLVEASGELEGGVLASRVFDSLIAQRSRDAGS